MIVSPDTRSQRGAAAALLRGFDERFESLIALLERGGLTADDRRRAQELLRELKDDLRATVKRMEAADRAGLLTGVERSHVLPALLGCSAQLRTRVNTRPGPEWLSNLSYARVDLTWMLHELEGPAGGREEAPGGAGRPRSGRADPPEPGSALRPGA